MPIDDQPTQSAMQRLAQEGADAAEGMRRMVTALDALQTQIPKWMSLLIDTTKARVEIMNAITLVERLVREIDAKLNSDPDTSPKSPST